MVEGTYSALQNCLNVDTREVAIDAQQNTSDVNKNGTNHNDII